MAPAQDQSRLPVPPDFSQPALTASAREVSEAWNSWIGTTGDLEQRTVRLPMSEARFLIQRALGRYLDFLEKRSNYSDAVYAYIEECRLHPAARMPKVTVDEVYEDQSRVIGINVLLLHRKLSALKEASEWTAVYAGSQDEANQALKLQSARRADIPAVLATNTPPPPETMSSLVYRKFENELQEMLRRLWTRFYQALVDAIEQKPDGSALLVPIRVHGSSGTSAAGNSSDGQTAPAPVVPEAWKSFVGAWSYAVGSQQFNGVAEPTSALLEIWFENNMLMGRYRAQLPDFQGFKKVDLRMQGTPANNSRQLTMRFESKDPPDAGQVILEPAGPSGVDRMLIRAVPAQGRVPRGRELLVHR